MSEYSWFWFVVGLCFWSVLEKLIGSHPVFQAGCLKAATLSQLRQEGTEPLQEVDKETFAHYLQLTMTLCHTLLISCFALTCYGGLCLPFLIPLRIFRSLTLGMFAWECLFVVRNPSRNKISPNDPLLAWLHHAFTTLYICNVGIGRSESPLLSYYIADLTTLSICLAAVAPVLDVHPLNVRFLRQVRLAFFFFCRIVGLAVFFIFGVVPHMSLTFLLTLPLFACYVTVYGMNVYYFWILIGRAKQG